MVVEPAASVKEAVVEVVHHEVNDSSVSVTDIALVTVLANVKSQRGIRVIVKRAQGLVASHRQPQGCGDLLNRKLIELHSNCSVNPVIAT